MNIKTRILVINNQRSNKPSQEGTAHLNEGPHN